LINIGEEEGKGNILAQATYPLLKENKVYIMAILKAGYPVDSRCMVCEGFTGNVVLKLAESVHDNRSA